MKTALKPPMQQHNFSDHMAHTGHTLESDWSYRIPCQMLLSITHVIFTTLRNQYQYLPTVQMMKLKKSQAVHGRAHIPDSLEVRSLLITMLLTPNDTARHRQWQIEVTEHTQHCKVSLESKSKFCQMLTQLRSFNTGKIPINTHFQLTLYFLPT